MLVYCAEQFRQYVTGTAFSKLHAVNEAEQLIKFSVRLWQTLVLFPFCRFVDVTCAENILKYECKL